MYIYLYDYNNARTYLEKSKEILTKIYKTEYNEIIASLYKTLIEVYFALD